MGHGVTLASVEHGSESIVQRVAGRHAVAATSLPVHYGVRLLLVAFSIGLAIDFFLSADVEIAGILDAVLAVGYLICCQSLWVAPRHPLGAMLMFTLGGAAGTVLFERQGLTAVLAGILLAVVVAVSKRWMIWTAVGLVLGWSIFSALYLVGSWAAVPSYHLFTVPGLILGLVMNGVLRALGHTRSRMQSMERMREEALERERQSLARDLHDIVAHQLTIISMVSGSRARSHEVDQLRGGLQEISSLSGEALEELRRLLGVLRNAQQQPRVGESQDTAATIGERDITQGIEQLAERLRGLDFDVNPCVEIGADPVRDSTIDSALRIMQEAVTNAVKYAVPGSTVLLSVQRVDDRLDIAVESALRAGTRGGRYERHRDARMSSGQGILSIEERATLLGGEAFVGPVGDTWCVRAALPV